MSSQQQANRFRLTGHIISVISGLILGVTGFIYAATLGINIQSTEFFWLMGFESVVATASIAWYAVSLKLTPTGIDLQTTQGGKQN